MKVHRLFLTTLHALVILAAGFFGATSLAFAANTTAPADKPQVQLTAYRVVTVKTSTGTAEQREPLGQVRPGDVVEYEAVYQNTGAAAARNVMVTLPVPAGGLQYVRSTSLPAQAEASLDGRSFAAMPLTRAERQADGRQVEREVPVAEYRFLRWNLGDLPAGSSRSVRARMHLPTLTR